MMATDLPFEHIDIVFNPKSSGDAEEHARKLSEQLSSQLPGIPVSLHATERAGHARDIARDCSGWVDRPLIVSVSGDGGYNEVIEGIMQANNPGAVAAVLGAGNANDHDESTSEQPLIDSILAGRTKKLDVLKMTLGTGQKKVTRWAHSYIGLGLTPAMAQGIEAGNKGPIKELVSAFRTFGELKPFTIQQDHRQIRLDSLIFANIPRMAKYASLSDSGEPDDGIFEVITFPHRQKVRLLLTALKAVTRGLTEGTRARDYSFVTTSAMDIQIDGELQKVDAGTEVNIGICHLGITSLA
ncbi:diacylglycerol kinase family protein [Saxibacter everestensis]|uniref:Diacylglycerol kinase family protein n=1 Tax=Saxibacter everestensis TaxID=2909229 RepID=A0ABY8QRU4_9MICO|nr:diacylglycerol kinase family protein [Brevibacteriaceae bacterium ZFBP1038]